MEPPAPGGRDGPHRRVGRCVSGPESIDGRSSCSRAGCHDRRQRRHVAGLSRRRQLHQSVLALGREDHRRIVMAFVIINGEIDLSVASVMGFSAAVMAALYVGGEIPFVVAIAIGDSRRSHRRASSGTSHHPVRPALARGHLGRFDRLPRSGAGLVGGPVRGRLPGMVRPARSATVARSAPARRGDLHRRLDIAWIILERGAFGRKVYAIGNSAEVARFAGIEVTG